MGFALDASSARTRNRAQQSRDIATTPVALGRFLCAILTQHHHTIIDAKPPRA